MSKKVNILFIIHNLSNGGAERVMSYLTVGFPNEKYNKYLVVYNRCNLEYDFDATCIDLNLVASKNIFSKIYTNLARIVKIKKIKRDLHIDKSISLLDSPNVMNLLSKRKEKVIVSVRNYKSGEVKGKGVWLYKLIGAFLYNKSDKIIAISEGVKHDLIDNYNIVEDKIQVIYNPINIEKVNLLKDENIEKEYESLFNGKTVINVGRLTNQKGQWHLIRAFSEVVKEIPDSKLIILGEGELKQYLQEIIVDFNLCESVYLLGFKKNPFKYVAKSDIFVLSSLYEGFGNVIIESMVSGTTVISTDCKHGPREILNTSFDLSDDLEVSKYVDFGVLVPRLTGERHYKEKELDSRELELAKTIINLINDKSIINNYKKSGYMRSKDFNSENIISKWINL